MEGVDRSAVQLRQKWKRSRMDFASMNCFGEVVTLWAGTQGCLGSGIDLVMDLCSKRPLAAPHVYGDHRPAVLTKKFKIYPPPKKQILRFSDHGAIPRVGGQCQKSNPGSHTCSYPPAPQPYPCPKSFKFINLNLNHKSSLCWPSSTESSSSPALCIH